jgi:hypothetical protein
MVFSHMYVSPIGDCVSVYRFTKCRDDFIIYKNEIKLNKARPLSAVLKVKCSFLSLRGKVFKIVFSTSSGCSVTENLKNITIIAKNN